MKRFVWIGFALLILISLSLLSCVSQSRYEALEQEYNTLKLEYTVLNNDYIALVDEVQYHQAQLDMYKLEREGLYADVVKLHGQINELEKQLLPSPDNALDESDVWGNSKFKSVAWIGRDWELQRKVEEIGYLYYSTHTFIPDETDCSDMATDIWNMLLTEGIISVIAIGNLDKEFAEFDECDHVWLIVFDPEGKWCVLEPTTGEVFLYQTTIPQEYTKFSFLYEKPSDLWADTKERM